MQPADYAAPIKAKKDSITGYWYFVDRAHPLARKNGIVILARHLVSVREGRWLRGGEVVVYADGNMDNLDPVNLRIMSRADLLRWQSPDRVALTCARCGKTFFERPSHAHLRRFCSEDCQRQGLRKFDVSAEELQKLVWEMPTTAVAAKFGVSDKAVEKRCKLLGVKKPPRGYWAKRAKEDAQARD